MGLTMYLRLLSSLAFTLMLGACAAVPQSAALRQQTPPDFVMPVLLPQVPFFAQELYQCGPAALAMLLGASGVSVTPEQLVPLVYVPERQGSFQVEMLAATRSHGRLAYRITPTLTALLDEITVGRPVLVLQNLGLQWYPRWHFAVVKGYDLERREVILNSGLLENYAVSLATFERTWARSGYWGMLALEPGTLPVQAEPLVYFTAVAALAQNNTPQQVDRTYVSGLSRWPQDPNLLMGYGNFLYSDNNPEGAATQYSILLAVDPEYAPAHNNLARLLFEQGQSELALMHARKAVELGGAFADNYRATLLMIETRMPR